jgi:trimethylamine:corrinoid methyltransferase-like protein
MEGRRSKKPKGGEMSSDGLTGGTTVKILDLDTEKVRRCVVQDIRNVARIVAEMRKMGYQGGGVECGIMQPAIHQLSQKVDVPNYASSGLSDSKGIFL